MDAIFLPAAMRLHVRLVDDIEAINVGEVVDAALVRVMRRAQRIDVVALHRDDVFLDLARVDGAAAVAVELVAVDALEDDALAIDLHDAAVHPELAETNVLRDDLDELARRVAYREERAVEIRMLGIPELRARDGKRKRGRFARRRVLCLCNDFARRVIERERDLLCFR